MPTKAGTVQRGYGAAHKRLRIIWQQRINQGHVTCWRCHRPIHPWMAWHLGHDDHDRSVWRGPEHVACNIAAANRNRARRRRRLVASRAW